MLTKYRSIVDAFSPGVCRALTVRLQLGADLPLYEELSRAGLGQADVVLELLHLTLYPEVEALIGHPIVRLPPRIARPWPQAPRRPPGPDDRRITFVCRNPRLPTTPSFQRFQLFRPGASLGSVVRRGVTRKDIRQALRAGWIRVEEPRCAG